MDCLKNKPVFIEWDKASRITSMPILVNKLGYKTEPPDCIKWLHGTYTIIGECPGKAGQLVTDQPAPPTKDCVFNIGQNISSAWLIKLALQESLLMEKEGFNVWLNTSIYTSVNDFKVSSRPFPGSVCGSDGTCYGTPNIRPLTAGSSRPVYSIEMKVSRKTMRIKPIENYRSVWMGRKGYARIDNKEWTGYIDRNRITGLFYLKNSSILEFETNYYRPRLTFLHPYSFVHGRMEEGESIISPVISLEGVDGRVLTIVSPSPVRASLNNGILRVESFKDEYPILVSENPPLASLKGLYNSMAPVVELDGYTTKRIKLPIASLRVGCGLIDYIDFNKDELLLNLYNPGENVCLGELKFTGVVSEASQDNNILEPLYDRVRISLPSHYYGQVKVRIKRSLSFLLRMRE
ncbi:MAG: hypothetical protein F7B60_01260 [Desulfurococcales archaeon]|nr:hypothetical protein [Desulfurococcales archaeon]